MLLIVFRIMHNMTAAGSGLDHHRILTALKPNTDSLHKLNQRLLSVKPEAVTILRPVFNILET